MTADLMHRIGALAVAAAIIGGAALDAAEPTGSVQGVVFDDQGDHLAGVRIVVTSTSLPDPIEERSGADGTFQIELPDVTLVYELRFELDGYQGVVHELDARQLQHASLEVRLPRAAPESASGTPGSTASAEPPGEQRRAAITLFNEGVTALEADDLDTADAKFRAAMEEDPTFPEPYRALAATAGEAEDWAAAAEYAEQLLRFEPDNVQAMSTVYFGHLMTGNVEAARQAAERLAAAEPDSLPQILDHGNTFFANNDFNMARALLEVSTASDPTRPDPYFALGVSCNALGDNAAAHAAFTRFLELAPPDHPDRTTAEEMLAYLE